MSWKKLLEFTKESLNDHMRLRNDYLMAENRILRHQINGRVQLTDSERQELAEIGSKLGKKALSEIATVARPDTILAWNRKFINQKMDTSERPTSVGRPRVNQEIEDWVIRMARENRSWGYDRIQGSLKHLGYTISDQTVGNILKRHGIPPAPERQKTITWREFIRSHWDVLMATDFFGSEVWSGLGLVVSYLLSFIHFNYHPIPSVMTALCEPMLALRRRALDLSLRQRRWAYLVIQQSQAEQDGQSVLEQIRSEFEFADARQRHSQDKVKVIALSAARPRPIRDGPVQHRQRDDSRSQDKLRKAA